MIEAIINGRTHQFEEGSSILDACRSVGISIPTLCHDERLKPLGTCRMCEVEIADRPHPVSACQTPLTSKMVITTESAALQNQRRMLLKMLARNYPVAAFRRSPEKPFHRYATQYGLTDADFTGISDPNLHDNSHTYIQVDMSRCILCQRCVQTCDEVQGQFVWQVINRGTDTRIVADSGGRLSDSSCVACGACVSTCPTGALEDKSIAAFGIPARWTRTVCPYCGVGCELNVGTNETDKIVTIAPVLNSGVNKGHLCVKGRYAYDFVSAEDRITEPMIRNQDGWHRVSWPEAVTFVGQKLEQIIDAHGPDSIAILGSARATNEENYLVQKFARTVLRTNNVDCCARVCHAPTAAAMKSMLGSGVATNSFDDIEKAKTILVAGANATENHPVIGARIRQATLNGAKLIVVDPRQVELANIATIHLRPRPGTNILLFNSLAYTIIDEGLIDHQFLKAHVDNWERFSDFIKTFAPERVEASCCVDAKLIREAARIYAKNKPSTCFHGLGVTEHTQGTEGVMCLVNLALLTGNLGSAGTGINPLRGQNNVQGAAHMGCDPKTVTGSVPLCNGELIEHEWGVSLPVNQGLNLPEMIDAANTERLKAMWIVGYDIALTNPDSSATANALASLQFVVVQDMFLNETARQFASVFLPAASSFEKDGTFMNSERRVQRIRKAIDPVGNSKTDWEIICLVARAMGRTESFTYSSTEEIWDEIRKVWPDGYGITYSRLEAGGLQWPCPRKDHPGTKFLHAESALNGTQFALRCVSHKPSPEILTDDYPFLLTTGRSLYQFNAGTMTMRTRNRDLRPTDLVEIAPADANRLGFLDGQNARIRSRYGEVVAPIRITSTVRTGELFATFQCSHIFLNRVSSSYRDPISDTPEYKVTAVQIERA